MFAMSGTAPYCAVNINHARHQVQISFAPILSFKASIQKAQKASVDLK